MYIRTHVRPLLIRYSKHNKKSSKMSLHRRLFPPYGLFGGQAWHLLSELAAVPTLLARTYTDRVDRS